MSQLLLEKVTATMRSTSGGQRWLWPIWLTVLSAWTFALLSRAPVEVNHELFTPDVGLSLGKLLHVLFYGMLAAGGRFLPCAAGWRWVPIAILSVHALTTEYLQQFVERTGCWEDVLLDCAGILTGIVLVAWLRLRAGLKSRVD